ncbi:MAG: small basic protein [Phycisphaerae bacterium]|nr:small basic protein [Phycisphaerae bacterium]
MSIDRSLKTAGNLARHRNVLTRAERISRLKDKEAWKDGGSVFGLPKVAHRNAKVGKKEKKKEEVATPGKEGEAPPPAATPAKK